MLENVKDNELAQIGYPISLGLHADPAYDITKKYFICTTRVADLIPISFKLALKSLMDNVSGTPVEYEFENAKEDFINKQKAVGFSDVKYGCRLWLTKESSASDTISTEFADNKVSEFLNNISSKGSVIRDMMKSVGVSGVYKGLSKEAQNTTARMAVNLLAEGKHASLPKIAKNINYEPNLSLTTNLVSPYGSKKSVKKHIIEPLMRLLCLISPSSNDGITYGGPSYLLIKAYGMSFINIGYIESINLNRGGGDTNYNKWRQPLNINVTLSIKPASPGFAILLDGFESANIEDSLNPPVMRSNNGRGPAFTTGGTIINSLSPAPIECDAVNALYVDALTEKFVDGLKYGNKVTDDALNNVNTMLNNMFGK